VVALRVDERPRVHPFPTSRDVAGSAGLAEGCAARLREGLRGGGVRWFLGRGGWRSIG
jgi:hypothetical protein